ncbi:MAG: FAD binding domain-containing protein [Dehalococcoidia bacterium]|jgi:carbon-monoxide dehydrogenase medium subunit|nr:FAD binding domain-containing protein [Dehalococcoidia bacterium]
MTNSHILVPDFEYLEPASLEEAVVLLTRHGKEVRVLAGGTDLIVQMKLERLAPRYLLNIRKIPGLDQIESEADGVRIGALTPIRGLRSDPRVQAWYPALAEACAAFSSTPVQVMGTVGGNLCNASPASDCAPPLIASSAEAVIGGPAGERLIPIEEFLLGPGRTALRTGELLAGVALRRPRQGTGSAFLKISRVAADIAKVNAAFSVVREGGRVVDCRLAFGSVAPTPVRARKAEALLVGRDFGTELVAEVAEAAMKEVSPIDDVRSAMWYRREMVRVLTLDGLHRAWERASREPPATNLEPHGATPSSPEGLESRPSANVRSAAQRHGIDLTVNGQRRRVWVMPNDLLLNVLREDLALTGCKYGCGIGECGACTVQLDGKPAASCLVLAVAAGGHEIVTVEGLQKPSGELDSLQQAFIEHSAFQCGYCTPGMLMTARSLLSENRRPSEDEVRDYLKGSFCRCTGHSSILRAVMSCAASAGGE